MPASNVLELTVGQLSGELKRTIEDRFGFVRVRGEISNYRGPHSSGHAYFCLKDESARIDAVVWKSAFAKLKTRPQEGLEVIATGRVTTFPGKSTYQLVIESLEPAGLGALMAILEARRKALAAEGLFDEARKRPLPFLPRVIGVVTSPTGAVIRDILHRLEDRFRCRVIVWPVRVQGETAAAEVAAAIAGFNALAPDAAIPRPDVLIVARGGGSLEDLWAFNEEIVVRAAAASAVPLIAGIGHETDWTLIDHAADLRAPTPSGAAEKAVPVRAELLTQQADLARRLAAAARRLVMQRRAEMRSLARALPGPDRLLDLPRQRLDALDLRLKGSRATLGDRRHIALARLGNRLAQQAPRTRLAHQFHALGVLDQRLRFCLSRLRERRGGDLARAGERLRAVSGALVRDLDRHGDRVRRTHAALVRARSAIWERRRDRLARTERLLDSLGYRQVLARGFALVRNADGTPVRRAADVTMPATLDIEFADAHVVVTTGTRSIAARGVSRPKPTQGSLF